MIYQSTHQHVSKKYGTLFPYGLFALVFAIVLLGNGIAFAVSDWTWIHGANGSDEMPSYGQIGVASPTNLPVERASSQYWTDTAGNFWLFGGQVSNNGVRNDLWKFDVSTAQWTWMKGSNSANQLGTYGAPNEASPENTPGAREKAATWVDSSGRFWLHGGMGLGSAPGNSIMGDLWMYDPGTNNWTWISGASSGSTNPSYGTVGFAAASNNPGSRMEATTWTDHDGIFWLYGGNSHIVSTGLNDLWKYNPVSGLWTWVGGSATSVPGGLPGVYGTQNEEAAANWPGSRTNSGSWVDDNGYLWLLGGFGRGESTFGAHNDLWRYNINNGQWAWIKGSKAAGSPGNYGEKGVPHPDNTPNSRTSPTCWTGSNGTLWLYGGGQNRSDVWKFDIPTSNWTWVNGSDQINQLGHYGNQGQENTVYRPGSRDKAASWCDNEGNLWMGTGQGYSLTAGLQNDLWKYNPASNAWTWVRGSCKPSIDGVAGTPGSTSPGHVPSARFSSMTWTDFNDNLWLFGGRRVTAHFTPPLGDLWKFSTELNAWTYVQGSAGGPVYGQKGVVAESNYPGIRENSVSWSDSNGNFWLFGGIATLLYNDLWKYDPLLQNWVWVSGTNDTERTGNYGTKGHASAFIYPGGRHGGVSWMDGDGNFWLFGGRGKGITATHGDLCDLWKYNVTTNEWTWTAGDPTINSTGIYGDRGVADPSNKPGGRKDAVSWVTSDGDLWMFGGAGYASTTTAGMLNDLWKYSPQSGLWTWVSGSDVADHIGEFGTQGVPHVANVPRSRMEAASWTDGDGNLWLFGGTGNTVGTSGVLNDLWKYDPDADLWTWMNGSSITGQNGIYGLQGIPTATNTPGARSSAIGWTDSDNNFWLFGSRTLNDLWKYNTGDDSGIPWQDAIRY